MIHLLHNCNFRVILYDSSSILTVNLVIRRMTINFRLLKLIASTLGRYKLSATIFERKP